MHIYKMLRSIIVMPNVRFLRRNFSQCGDFNGFIIKMANILFAFLARLISWVYVYTCMYKHKHKQATLVHFISDSNSAYVESRTSSGRVEFVRVHSSGLTTEVAHREKSDDEVSRNYARKNCSDLRSRPYLKRRNRAVFWKTELSYRTCQRAFTGGLILSSSVPIFAQTGKLNTSS